jgi:dimethylamine/trimethylamine dehydrogenase
VLENGEVTIEHISSGKSRNLETGNLAMVTARRPQHDLYFELEGDPDALQEAGIKSVTRIGDCVAPSTIAAAVYAGHLYAREFDCEIDIDKVQYLRERPEI